jgi:mannose-6-phosphate isomerase-like protein (cupin superfamily)
MSEAMRKATHARHYAEAPQMTDKDGSRHWITRAANFVVVVTDAKKGAVLDRSDNPDEYMLLLTPGTDANVEADGGRLEAKGNTLTIVPPGQSRVIVQKPGILARVFSNKAADLTSKAANAATYADGAPEVAPIVPWPDPAGGFRLRHYKLDEIASPDPTPLKMRVFRSTNLMINIFEPWLKRRDETKLSPHSHEDFEQVSLALEGSFVHHLRYPWGPNKTAWKEDEHEHYDSPSCLVIPPRVVHTTQDVGAGTTWLIDVFGPPRVDFSSRPGFVLNADDYPMPARA